jgi:hypothetical protein
MSNPPWWFSGDEPSPESPPPRLDPGMLIAAANQLVDWATERIVTPHAEHTDPGGHPTCVLCRSSSVVQGLAGAFGEQPQPTSEQEHSEAPSGIRWIPTVDHRDASWD